MNAIGLFERCLEMKVGDVVRGEPYGAVFDVFRYETAWWCYWRSEMLTLQYEATGCIGMKCPLARQDFLWAMCIEEFSRVSVFRVKAFPPTPLINPPDEGE